MCSQGWISTRNTLWLLAFSGRAVNDMIRSNLNIGIVAMVRHRFHKEDGISNVSECFNASSPQVMINNTQEILPEIFDESRFDWDEYQQGLILGAYYWLYWMTSLAGGVLIHRKGGKFVFTTCNFLSCLIAGFIPLSANISFIFLIILRVIQGLLGGLNVPVISAMATDWIPPNERSKFFAAYLGDSVGSVLMLPIFGFLIHWTGWPTIFYMTTVIGTVWSIAWHFLVYNTPAEHPRISESERTYIENSLGKRETKKKLPIPWKSILTSLPIWMNCIACSSAAWGLLMLMTQSPTYLTNIHGMRAHMAGVFSGFPHICRIVAGLVLSLLADYILKKELFSRTTVHKGLTVIATIVQGVFIIGIAFSGCNTTAAVICMGLALGFSGVLTAGPPASLVDNCPNFASIAMSLSNFCSMFPTFTSPIIVGLITYQNQTSGQWKLVFLISALPMIIVGFLYILFASSELQPWNSPTDPEKEMENLKKSDHQEECMQGTD